MSSSARNKPSALAVRVAAERRQRAIMAMLRDEQSELMEQLDERFHELNAQGLVITGRQKDEEKRRRTTENGTKMEGKTVGDKQPMPPQQQQQSAESTDYDQLYFDFQLLPPVRSTATQCQGAQIVAGQQDDSTMPAQSAQHSDTAPLDFGIELDKFLEHASAVGASSSANIAKLDGLLRDRLQPALEKCPTSGPRHILDKLAEFHSDFLRSKNGRAVSPSFVQVAFLQMVAKLFPSDARFHPILTPSIALASELIGHTRVRSIAQCARLTFLSAQMCEGFCCGGARPRFFPEVLAFLLGALQLCCESKKSGGETAPNCGEDKSSEALSSSPPPFPSMNFPISFPHRQMLFVPRKQQQQQVAIAANDKPRQMGTSACLGALSLGQMFHSTNLEEDDDDDAAGNENGNDDDTDADECAVPVDDQCLHRRRLRLLTIRALFATIGRYAHRYGADDNDDAAAAMRPAFNACFGPFHRICLRLPLENYPVELVDEALRLTQLLAKLLAQNAHVTQMKRAAKRGGPSALKMLEPRFEERFDPEKRHFNKQRNNNNNNETAAAAREKSWAKRAKTERRGALKELRKDARGMASAYADRQRKVRQERDEKTKRILQCLEVQESEHKKFKALKK